MKICLRSLKIRSFLLFYFLLSILFIRNYADEGCANRKFYIEYGNGVEGKLIEKFETSVLDECIERCRKTAKCTGANFLVNLDGLVLCLLHDTSSNGLGSETPASETVMYSIKSYCPSNQTIFCHDSSSTFHKFSNYDVINSSFVLETLVDKSLDYCLTECHNNVSCESVLYDSSSKLCKFLLISLQNVHNPKLYFVYSKKVDLYESNCMKRSFDMTKCNFLRVNHGGFTDVFDARVESVADSSTCERVCLSWSSGICRSYTYDSLRRMCYLSHSAHRTLGRNPLENMSSNLKTGELDDCLHFKLDCKKNSMTVSGESMKMFSGMLKTKKGKNVMCEEKVNGPYKFSTDIEYNKCGIEKKMQPYPTYTGMLMVKEGSTDLITIRDKMIQLTCRMHPEIESMNQNLAFHFDVIDGNETLSLLDDKIQKQDSRIPTIGKPKYRLEVLNKNERLAEVVHVGEIGYIVIVEESDGFLASKIFNKFEVSDLIAIDSKTGDEVELIDENGCIINGSMIVSIDKQIENRLKIKILFDGFSNKTQVIYEALVKPCFYNCYKECNAKFYTFDYKEAREPIRTKRSVVIDARQFELSEDLYQIRSREKVHIFEETEPLELMKSSEKSSVTSDFINKLEVLKDVEESDQKVFKEKIKNSFSKCLTEDLSCVFTVILILLQLILLISCGFIIYVYIEHWINRVFQRREQEELYNEIQFEFTNPNHEEVSETQNMTRAKSDETPR